jgi:hypothetical protein
VQPEQVLHRQPEVQRPEEVTSSRSS